MKNLRVAVKIFVPQGKINPYGNKFAAIMQAAHQLPSYFYRGGAFVRHTFFRFGKCERNSFDGLKVAAVKGNLLFHLR